LSLMQKHVWTVLLLGYCGLIYYLSDQTMLPVPHVFDVQDKLIHAVAYAVMAFLFWQAGKAWMVQRGTMNEKVLGLICIVFCSAYGLSDELHQSFIIGRDASVFDWIADTIGAMLLTFILQKKDFMSLQRK